MIIALNDYLLRISSVECQDGYFGENCIRVCPIQCHSCNKSSGICDQGCHPGWKGTYCTEGMYCNQSLGY